jgi:TPR repeat protein
VLSQEIGFDDQITASANKEFQKKLEAAKTGNPVAQYSVGRAFQKGKGVKQNHDLAARWLRKAAE